MPGWHEATKTLQERGDIQLVGIVQEQHGDRAKLFMQWKQMDWPVMVDAQNLLGVAVVPIVVLIDGGGIVRHVQPKQAPAEAIATFLAETHDEPGDSWVVAPLRPNMKKLKSAARNGTPRDSRRYAQAIVDWGRAESLADAIAEYERAIDRDPEDAPTRFRLGVAYRKRFDSPAAASGDFQRAVDRWNEALERDPNQYIWRRRIQQYGPRLIKPYPFYDWVDEARDEISQRSETPVELIAEPSGAEIAMPVRTFTSAGEGAKEPDPDGLVFSDDEGFIDVETTIVPLAVKPGQTARVHIVFRPSAKAKGHWNNEAEPMSLWVDPPAGCRVDARLLSAPNPPMAVSGETRRFELELQVPEDAKPGALTVPLYALYNVCEREDGRCLYRRQDMSVTLTVE